MDKILTVVIPTYNMEGYLDKCLTSLIVPDLMDDLEVLVINDGSKDSSLQIARKYEALYPQTFIAVDKLNGNYGSCVNKGLELATGKYFKVLDADDTFNNENFRDFLVYLKQTDAELILSDFFIIYQDKGTKERIGYDLHVGITFSFDYFAKKNVPYLWMHAITHLTAKLRSINYQQLEGISYTDKEFVFYPVAVSKSVAYFPKVIYNYLMGREGQTVNSSVWFKNYWMEEKAIKRILSIYDEHKADVSDGGRFFMKQQAIIYVSSIYNSYLDKYLGEIPIQGLKDFDDYIKDLDKDVYDKMNNLRGKAYFRYVKVWRKYKFNMNLFWAHRFIYMFTFNLGLHHR